MCFFGAGVIARGRMLERGRSLRPSAEAPRAGEGVSSNRPALIPEVGTAAGPSFCTPTRSRLLDLAGNGYLNESQRLVQ